MATIPAKIVNEELVSRRRQELIEASTELFLKQGFHKTSVREIASAVGWNMGMLYAYISCKEDVLYLIHRNFLDQTWEHRPTKQLGTVEQTLRVALKYWFRMVDKDRRQFKLLYRESASLRPEHLEEIKDSETQQRTYFATIIRDGFARGEFRAVDAELVAQNILSMCHSWALKGWWLRREFTFDEYEELQSDLVFRMLKA